MRPDKLSNDNATSIEAVIHAIEWLYSKNIKPDGIMLLQPTLPFRKIKTIVEAVKLFSDNDFSSVVSFSRVNFSQGTKIDQFTNTIEKGPDPRFGQILSSFENCLANNNFPSLDNCLLIEGGSKLVYIDFI